MSGHLNSSYFYAVDSVHGWGNMTFFTYFSQFNRSSPSIAIVEATLLILLFIVCLCGNTLLIVHILRMPSSRTVVNYLVCNLALVDILFTTGSPLIAVARVSQTWLLGRFTCSMLVYMELSCGLILIWTMTIISMDRYRCINKNNVQRLTTRHAVIILAVIWASVFVTVVPVSLYFDVLSFPSGDDDVSICTLVWPHNSHIHFSLVYTTTLCTVGFVIPLGLITHNYYQIYQKFQQTRKAIEHNFAINDGIWTHSLRWKHARNQKDNNVVRTLVMLVVLFILMWFPIFVVFGVIQYNGMTGKMQISSQAFIGALAIAHANACVNPFVYGFMNLKLRRSIVSCSPCQHTPRIQNLEDAEHAPATRTLSFGQYSVDIKWNIWR